LCAGKEKKVISKLINIEALLNITISLACAYFFIRFLVRFFVPELDLKAKVLCFLSGALLCVLIGFLLWLLGQKMLIGLILLGWLLFWSYVAGVAFCENKSSTEKTALSTRLKYIAVGVFVHAVFVYLWVFALLSIVTACRMGMGGFSNLGSFMLHSRIFHVLLAMAFIAAATVKVIGFFTSERVSFFEILFSLGAVPFIIAILMALFVAICLLLLPFGVGTPGPIIDVPP
jgi:hypothetical protein